MSGFLLGGAIPRGEGVLSRLLLSLGLLVFLSLPARAVTLLGDSFATATNTAAKYSNWAGDTRWDYTGAISQDANWEQLSTTTGGPKQGAGTLGLLGSAGATKVWISTPKISTVDSYSIKISFTWETYTNGTAASQFQVEWSTDSITWNDITAAGFGPDTEGKTKVISNIAVGTDAQVANQAQLWIRWVSLTGSNCDRVIFDTVTITGVPLTPVFAVNLGDSFTTAVDGATRYADWSGDSQWDYAGGPTQHANWQPLSNATGAPKQGTGQLGLLGSGGATGAKVWIASPAVSTLDSYAIKISFTWETYLNGTAASQFKVQWSTDSTTWNDIDGAGFGPDTEGKTKTISNLRVGTNAQVGNKSQVWIRWVSLTASNCDKVIFDTVTLLGEVKASGFGTAVLTSDTPENAGDTSQSVSIYVRGTATNTVETFSITVPPNATWGGTMGSVTLADDTYAGNWVDSTITGTGTMADSYILTFRNATATNLDGCTVTITGVSYTGNGILSANGLFNFVVKTASGSQAPAEIAASPKLLVRIPPGKILISEIAVGGANEWIEFYNPNTYVLDLSGADIATGAQAPDATIPGNETIAGYGFYLLADAGYLGTADAAPEAITFSDVNDGVQLRSAYGDTVLDAVGWGTEGVLKEGTALASPTGADKTFERLSLGAADSSQHNSTGGNGEDSNDNISDLFERAAADSTPQTSTSDTEAPSPVTGGSGAIDKTAKVAEGGRGSWTLTYSAGTSDPFTNGRVDLKVPAGWQAPQLSTPAAPGYVNITVQNGTLTSSYVSGNTVAVLLSSLTAGSGKVIFEYGYTNGGTNRDALGRIQTGTASAQFRFAVNSTSQDTSLLSDISQQPTTLKVVTLTGGDSSFSPSANPQSFIDATYDVTLTVKDSTAAVVYGAHVSADITQDPPSNDAEISEVSGGAYIGTSTTIKVRGYTDVSGLYKVTLNLATDSGLNEVTFNIETSTLTAVYQDSGRPPNPVISEALWSGFGGSANEFVEIYNPRSDTVLLGAQGDSFHVGDNNGIASVATIANFSGISIGPHRYIVIAGSSNIPDVDITNAGISLGNSGETLTVYRDTVTLNEVVDRHPTGAWLAGTNDADRRSMERLWVNRTASQAANWGNADSPTLYAASTHNATPGLPNSIALYNSTVDGAETQTNNREPESVAITVTMLLNTGDTQPGQPVTLSSSRGAGVDTFTQPGLTNLNGITVGYVVSTTTGTATVSCTYPRGITDTVVIVFDFDSPNVPALLTPATNHETWIQTPGLVWAATTDTTTGIGSYWVQIDNNSDFSSVTAESTARPATTFTPTASLAYDTYYWRVRARDGAGNLGDWSDSRLFSVERATDTPTLLNPTATPLDFENTTSVTVQWRFNDQQTTDTQGSYEVQIDTGTNPDWTSLADSKPKTAGNANNFVSATLSNGQWYSVRVRTWDAAGETSPAWSDSAAFYVLKRVADGVAGDWAGTLPSDSDASLISNGEFVWRDRVGDKRADGTNPDENYDLKAFYLTADTYFLYLRFDVVDLTAAGLPLFALAIDTNQAAADGGMDWIGDEAASGGNVLLGRGGLQYSERNIDMSYEAADSKAFVFTENAANWHRPAFRPAEDFYGTTTDIVEYAIPREEAGIEFSSTIRVSLGVTENQGAVSDPGVGNNTRGGAANNNDILDDLFPGTGNAWDDDISDSDIDYYVDIAIDANGNAASNNAPSAVGITATSPANGSEITNLSPTFQWSAGTDADGSDTLTYHFQLATSSAFTSLTAETSLNQSALWAYPNTLTNSETYYWRVRARDNHGTLSSAWSSTFSFKTRLRGRIDGVADDWFGIPSGTGHDTVISEGEFIYTGVSGDQRLDGPADADVDITEVRFSGDTDYMYLLVRHADVTATDEIYIGFNIDADMSSGDGALSWIGDDATGNAIDTSAAYGETNVALHKTPGGLKIEIYDQNGAGNAWHAPVAGSADSVSISLANNLTEAGLKWADLRPVVLPQRVRVTLVSYDNVDTWNNLGNATGNYFAEDGLDVLTPHAASGANAWDRDLSNGRYDSFVTIPYNRTGRVDYYPPKPSLASPAAAAVFGDTENTVTFVWTITDTDAADAVDSGVRVQISRNSSFSSFVVDTEFANRPTTKSFTLTVGDTYYWRVRDRDDFETSAFSDSRMFRINGPATTDFSLTKTARQATLGAIPVTPRPGATIEYEFSYTNSGGATADSAILRDSIPVNSRIDTASTASDTLGASATFHDADATLGWKLQHATVSSPNQSYTSGDYIDGLPADKSTVRWIRWIRRTVPAAETKTIRFRVILQ